MALREDRERAVELVHEPFAARAAQLGLSGEVAMRYRPRSRATDVEEFVAELHERLPGELERGLAPTAPTATSSLFLRDGRELRSYGSQGELRLALLALLLAERSVLAPSAGAHAADAARRRDERARFASAVSCSPRSSPTVARA